MNDINCYSINAFRDNINNYNINAFQALTEECMSRVSVAFD